ncbi:metallophosphoesterase [Actinoplanes palleronii]|uniref:Phosphohydrolase n=1 Tax=Actinoplanes palleronii TaxID=113570 RepID=A0ABQ4B8Y2_9ACTN|nr:metallophosphoesterase [Actinoplanes palleronii]GIE67164.1 phosphohydrolase [Actinoplanes palleronii]
MRILHLSDTHVTAAAGVNRDGIDAREALRGMLLDCAEVPGLDVVLVTGDVADDGSVTAYRDVLAMVGGFARERRVPVVFTTGNHDERGAFTEVLGSGHLGADGRDGAVEWLRSAGGERAAVTVVGGYRIITLDSLVPGEPYGWISPVQRDWLRGVLARTPYRSILAFHHPPLAVPGVLAQEAMGLRDGDDLAAVIAGTDVGLILCGHFHSQVSGFLAGVPVWVTPGVVNRIDLTAAPDTVRAVRGASASLVDLGGPHSPVLHTLHARDPRAGQPAYDVGADRIAELSIRYGRRSS